MAKDSAAHIESIQSPPYTHNTQAVKGPRNTGGPPCSQICFNFSFVFEFVKRLKTWTIIYFNAVRCHPLYVKISQIMQRDCRTVFWPRLEKTSWKSKKKKKEFESVDLYWAVEEILFLKRFPWARFKMEWITDKCISSILSSHPPSPPPATEFCVGPPEVLDRHLVNP